MTTTQPSTPIPFPTPLLDQRLAQQKANNECDRQRLLREAQQWLEQNALKFGIDHGYLFGSMTQPGQFSQFSDLDLALDSLSQGEPFGLISHLSTFLDRDVDLVPLDQCHFAHKIQKEGVQWSATKLRD
jgi:uncharacterized protein